MNIAILGAGISGVSLWDILHSVYGIKCDIYEKGDSLGGLCRTKVLDGYVFDLSGEHVFNSKYEEVKEYVFGHLEEKDWKYSRRKSKILFHDEIIDYPFEFSLSQLPTAIAAECFEGLYRRTTIKAENFYEFLINNFGEGIVRHYLKPYNEKIWKTKLTGMGSDWVEGKMPYPSLNEILLRSLTKETNEKGMVHSCYYYPLKGGIQAFIDSLGKEVPIGHIGESVNSIAFINNKVEINGKLYDLVVSTIPLPELKKAILSLDDKVGNCINNLKYNSLQSYLFSIKKSHDYSWLYIPDKDIMAHRIVYQGNFANDNAPNGKSSAIIEVTGIGDYNEPEIVENIRSKLNLSNPDAKHFTKYAYVIYDHNRSKNIQIIKNYMSNNNIVLHGRFAEWTYPNMDTCIKNSMTLAKKVFSLVCEG